MASSSSSSSSPSLRTWTYRVFTSFHGPDVRKTFLTHLRKQFSSNGISMFDDQRIERSQIIAPALTQAIRESRISIVVLSKNYASSGWCLDELVEIFKCKEDLGQIVMTVFYGVDPYDVRKQSGEFGRVFNKTCARRTAEERRRWSQALTDASNIAGEHFLNWENESEMIEKMARDVSNKLNTTISRDFDDMVGIEAHLENMQSLLHLEYEDEALIVGISGPAGIGKTTIARALHSRLSSNFQLSCFMENIRGSYNSGLDEYGSKLCLQEKLLSKILNQNGMRIHHLGAVPERLCDQKVLIILDDVDDIKQLEALVNETTWFGRGSRIIITTSDQELLEQHGIKHTYHVGFPTKQEARKIFGRYAFRRNLVPDSFEKLVDRVTELSSNLPLGLRVIGSILRNKNEEDWEYILRRLERRLDRSIEGVLRVGFDILQKDDQLLFLLIAFFFNYQDENHVETMLAASNFEVRLGLKTLAYKSFLQISNEGKIVIHKLLQQMGREVVQRQELGKCQILIDNYEICDVLENDLGNGNVIGISLDISTLSSDVHISSGAFQRLRNLQYLNIHKTCFDTDNRVHVPEDMDFECRLRLLNWEEYPGKCLPPTSRPEYLVELNLKSNKLEKLWEGIQPLTSLKKLSLKNSVNLKELPDLSNATNLESLRLNYCIRLVEIPSSIGNLQKLEKLDMELCVNLQVVPTHPNLASLKTVNMLGCRQLRKIPDIFRNIAELAITDTMLEDFHESISLLSRLESLYLVNCDVKTLSMIMGYVGNLPKWVDWFERAYIKDLDVDMEKIPDWIKDLHGLEDLILVGCPKLTSLPELPASIKRLGAFTCESLETLMPFPSESQIEHLNFTNCSKLGKEACKVIQNSDKAWLPGRNVPAEFDHRNTGNSLTIPSGAIEFRCCVVISPQQQMKGHFDLLWHISRNGFLSEEGTLVQCSFTFKMEHLYIGYFIPQEKLESDALLEFNTTSKNVDVIECGIQIFTDESLSEQVSENDNESSSGEDNESKVPEDLTRSELISEVIPIVVGFCCGFVIAGVIKKLVYKYIMKKCD